MYGANLAGLVSPINASLKQFSDLVQSISRPNQDLLRISAIVAEIPKRDFSRFGVVPLEAFRSVFDQKKLLGPAVARFAEMNSDFYGGANVRQAFLQQIDLMNSSVGTIAFAGSLRQAEIDSIQKSMVAGLVAAHSDLFKSINSSFLDSLKTSKIFENIEAIQKTFAGQLAAQFREILENSGSDDEVFSQISSIVDASLRKSEQSGFTKFELITVILAIVAIVISLYGVALQTYQFADSKKAEELQNARFERLLQLGEQVIKNNSEDFENDLDGIYYKVERKVKLVSKPSFKSDCLGYLYPSARVRVLFSNHKWIFVESFNFIEGIPQYGWVNKKYLSRAK